VDNPAVFETRIKEYEERTAPILEALKKEGYKIYEVDGNPLPFDVFAEIKQKLGL
jgi:adenylate kinase family enzyme